MGMRAQVVRPKVRAHMHSTGLARKLKKKKRLNPKKKRKRLRKKAEEEKKKVVVILNAWERVRLPYNKNGVNGQRYNALVFFQITEDSTFSFFHGSSWPRNNECSYPVDWHLALLVFLYLLSILTAIHTYATTRRPVVNTYGTVGWPFLTADTIPYIVVQLNLWPSLWGSHQPG